MPLITHDEVQKDLEAAVSAIRTKIAQAGDTEAGTVQEKLGILSQLTEFELGRYLLLNGGLNGRWTHYVSFEYPRMPAAAKPAHPIERRLLDVWVFRGLEFRLETTKRLLQSRLKDGDALLSVPCGLMADLLTLDFRHASPSRLVGIDLDGESLERARRFAVELGLESRASFLEKDVFELGRGGDGQFDAITCLGLVPYIEEKDKEMELYRIFHRSLRPGGRALIAFSTPPRAVNPASEQDLSSIDPAEIRFYRMVFKEIVPMRIRNFSTGRELMDRLRAVGFAGVEIHYDRHKSRGVAVATRS